MDKKRFYYMNAAELMDCVLDVYKKCFFKQLALSIIFNIIFTAVLYALIFVGVFAAVFVAAATMDYTSPGFLLSIFLIIVIVFISIIFVQTLTATGNALLTKRAFLNEKSDLGAVIKTTFKKLIPVSTVAIAEAIIFIPVYALLALFLYLYFKIIMAITVINSTSQLVILIVATILLLLLIIVISIFISSFSMMSTAVAVFEQKYFFSAVIKSFQLAKPDFFKILGMVIVWNLISMAASYSFTSLITLSSGILDNFLPSDISNAISIMGVMFNYILSAIMGVLLAPLSGIFATLMYINQRFKHEGLDIELNINMPEIQHHTNSVFNHRN